MILAEAIRSLSWAALIVLSLILGLRWLLPIVLDQFLARDLEKFKIETQARHDQEIERLRGDLRVAAFEHETRFSKLHEQRGLVIAELYRLLDKLHRSMSQFLRPVQGVGSHAELGDEVIGHSRGLVEYFDANRIYFDEDFCKKMDVFAIKIKAAWSDFHTKAMGDNFAKSAEYWLEIWYKFESDIPPLREEIERTMREMLGVGTKKPTDKE